MCQWVNMLLSGRRVDGKKDNTVGMTAVVTAVNNSSSGWHSNHIISTPHALIFGLQFRFILFILFTPRNLSALEYALLPPGNPVRRIKFKYLRSDLPCLASVT